MSPDPYVRGQLVAVALSILVCALFASWRAALVLGICTLFGATLMDQRYRRDVSAEASVTPDRRRDLDQMVRRDQRVVLASLALAVLVAAVADLSLLPAVHPYRVAVVTTAIVATSIYLSSLVDWFVILPRVSGQLGFRPCRHRKAKFLSRPRTWKETTRWWLIHRSAATIVFRVGLSVALANVVGQLADLGLSGKVAIAAVTGLVGGYVSGLRAALPECVDTQRVVGETIRVGTIKPPRWQLPWKPFSIPDLPGRLYVMDIDISALQLVELAPYEEEAAPPREFPDRPSQLQLRFLAATSSDSPATTTCQGRCGRINWYCIQNPACYEHK